MPRLMEKKDWMQTVADVGSAENVWYGNVSAKSVFSRFLYLRAACIASFSSRSAMNRPQSCRNRSRRATISVAAGKITMVALPRLKSSFAKAAEDKSAGCRIGRGMYYSCPAHARQDNLSRTFPTTTPIQIPLANPT